VWTTGCTSWYQSAEGGNFALWPFSTWKFWLETRKVKESDYDFGYAKPPMLGKKNKEKAAATT